MQRTAPTVLQGLARMSGTKTQREMRAVDLLNTIRTMATTQKIAAVCDFESEQYQRGFQEGYELGQQPEELKAPVKVNPLKAVKQPKGTA